MKFIAHFFLKKLPRGTQEQNLGAYSRDFPDTKVAIEETKEEADALGADIFELETETGSLNSNSGVREVLRVGTKVLLLCSSWKLL
jgi:uncharacterized protein YbjQ (UPF0145 family)